MNEDTCITCGARAEVKIHALQDRKSGEQYSEQMMYLCSTGDPAHTTYGPMLGTGPTDA